MPLNIVILGHTYGPDKSGNDLLSAHQVIEHTIRMRNTWVMRLNGRVSATHIAHEGNPVHPELEEFARQNGYKFAFDNLVQNI